MTTRILIEATSDYRFAAQTVEADGYSWIGRLLNTPALETAGKASDAGNPVREISIELDNADNIIDLTTETLWGSTVTLYIDDVTETWVGKIRSWSRNNQGILSMMAAEDTLAVFKKPFPDEVVRLATYSDAGRDATNTTIPIVLGGTAADPVRVVGILVDRVNFRFLLCVGEIRQVVAVLKDRTTITEGFTAYTGTAGQSVYPGFAYIEFAADPRDSAGKWPEILVDVVGLKLGASSEAESRNPARQIQYLLTTAATGACGWGLGIASGDLDSTAFATAISDCDTAGFVADGAIFQQKTAAFWIDQLCKACRGSLKTVSGKWTLTIDKVRSSVKTYLADDMRLAFYGHGASSERKNRVVVEYRYDATDGRMLGSAQREDATSQTAIGTNEYRTDLFLVRDHAAGGKIADYLLRAEQYGEDRIEFDTDTFAGVAVGDVITITRADLGLSGALFAVQRITVSGSFARIEARSYSDSIYANADPDTPPSDPATDPFVPAAAPPSPPAEASGVSLSTGVRVQADGTTIAYVDGVYTMPSAALFVRVEVGEGATPATWLQVGSFSDGTFHHEPCKPGQNYTYRLFCVNAGGASAAVTANITAEADTTAPGVPVAPTTELLFKSIIVKIAQNATKAPDLAGFEVWRSETADSGDATKVGFVACGGTADGASFLDETTGYGTDYYYWAKAVDKTGNTSAFSDASAKVTTQGIVSGDLAAGALASSDLFACGVVDAAAIANCAVTAAKTCLAAIDQTSGCLTACSVATCNLQAGAITGEKIYAGAITGDKIAANTITASHLLIAAPGAALNEDPAFADSSAWTTCSGNSYFCTVSDGKVGNTVIRSSAAGCAAWPFSTKRIPVDPNKTYRVRVWVRKSATANGTLYLSWRTYNSSDVGIPSNYGYYICAGVTPGTSWTEYSVLVGYGTSWPATSDARTMNIGLGLNYSGTAGYVEAQDFRLEEVLPATLIQDGAITTSKIIATGIDGACICAGSITTGHLSASGICADCIKAGTLSGVTVCACTGLIGGWSICGTYIMGAVSGTGSVGMFPAYPTIQLEAADSSNCTVSYMELGKMYWCGGWKNGFGYSMTRGSNAPPDIAFGIANKGSVVLPDSSTVDCMCPFFWIGDSSAHMKYYGGVLTVSGTLCSGNGTIGGWCICPNFIAKSDTNGDVVLWSQCNSVYTTGCISGGGYIQAMHGRIYDCRGIRCAVGYSFYKGGSLFTFATGIPLASGVVSLPDATTTYLTAGCPFFWVGDSSAYMKYYGGALTVLGTVCATAGCFTGTVTSTSGNIATLCMDANGLKSTYDNMGMSFVRTYSSSLGKYVGARIDLCGNVSPESGSVGYSFIKLEGGMNGCTTGAVAPIWIDMTASSCYAISTDGRIYASAFCSSSDRLCKSNIRPVDVLPRLRGLPITEWTFSDSVTRRIGPMAQDFFQQFPFYSDSPEAVGGLDGIALKAAQELDGCVGCLQACICSLESRLANLEARLLTCAIQ